MRHLMVLFDKNRTVANLVTTTSLHIILVIFTAAGLTKPSRAVWGAFALVQYFSKQQ